MTLKDDYVFTAMVNIPLSFTDQFTHTITYWIKSFYLSLIYSLSPF